MSSTRYKPETVTLGFDFKTGKFINYVDKKQYTWQEPPTSALVLELSHYKTAMKGHCRTIEFSVGDMPGWTGFRLRIFKFEMSFGRWKI